MKQSKYTLAIFILFFCSLSCKKDFLEIPDGTSILRNEAVFNLASTEQYLNGVHILLGMDMYRYQIAIYPELIADNIRPAAGKTRLLAHYKWGQIASDEATSSISDNGTHVNGLSTSIYGIIRAANFVIEKAGEYRNEDPAKADHLKGQSLAIRALSHFWLVNVFAQSYNFTADGSHPGVAYVTSSDYTQPIAGRQTVSEVYDNMIADLNNSIQLISTDATNRFYVTKVFAKGLLSRIYLFKGNYADAKNLAKDVINEVPLMTSDYPEKLFTPEETETLFQLPPSSAGYPTAFAGVRFSADFRATNDIAGLLREDLNDKRSAWVTSTSNGFRITKFPQGVVPDVSPAAGSYYQSVMRSSEMYLTAAESFAKLNVEDSAIYYLDMVKMRANPSATTTTATGPALLDSIYKERRKELAFESLRMFDLLRWKKGVDRVDATPGSPNNLPYPNNKAIAPVPGLDVSVLHFSQNPGY